MKKAFLLIGLIVATATSMFGQAIYRTIKRLPDTKQRGNYTSTKGEDSDYEINPPYFLSHGNGIVTDTVTSLMWQQTDGGAMTYAQAVLYCDTLSLGGYTDWRLPFSHELFSIQDFGVSNPALDTSVFTITPAEYWWSFDRQVTDTNKIWATNSGGGIGPHPASEAIGAGGSKRFHVRAVRSQYPSDIIEHYFTDNGDQTVTDNLTGLIWQQFCIPNMLTWEQALYAADTLTLAGKADWRLPNIRELQSINREVRSNPSLELYYFPCVSSQDRLWSSTTLLGQGFSKAWLLQTDIGIVTYDLKNVSLKVLCVRGGTDVISNVQDTKTIGCEKLTITPNPIYHTATITYQIVEPSDIRIGVFNVVGEKIIEWNYNSIEAGIYQEEWNVLEHMAGLYLCVMEVSPKKSLELTKQQIIRPIVVHGL